LGRVTVEPVPVPADSFALLDGRLVADGVARLERDLTNRSWHSRYASLLTLPELDVGYRLVIAELG
jgi:hypothetical protein